MSKLTGTPTPITPGSGITNIVLFKITICFSLLLVEFLFRRRGSWEYNHFPKKCVALRKKDVPICLYQFEAGLLIPPRFGSYQQTHMLLKIALLFESRLYR